MAETADRMIKGVCAALLLQSLVIGGLLLVVADQVAHTRVERLGGVNIWGYRGPVLTQKRADEIRLAVVGGDLAFSWGVAATQTLAQSIRDYVAFSIDVPRGSRAVTAVTLGAIGLPPSGYASWIERFGSLRPDVLVIVPDPIGHLPGPSAFLPARSSAAFRAFGYSPILPLVLQERGAMRHSLVSRLAGAALERADGLFRSESVGNTTPLAGPAYLAAVGSAIRAAVGTAPAGVVVVTPVDAAAGSIDRDGVKALVASTFAGSSVQVVDLGGDPAMRVAGLRLDGFNFSAAGYAAAGQEIAPAVISLLTMRGLGPR
jgi:hypothetical protein